MLAKRRGFYRDGKEIVRTPLLLPSFSSKGFPEVQDIIEGTSQIIDGPCLVSAYDLHYGLIKPPFDFAQAVFVDSGGYESSKDLELSDLGSTPYEPGKWTQEFFNTVIGGWSSTRPTVLISYDHPKERTATTEQIVRADAMLPKKDNIYREILLKPELQLTGIEPELEGAIRVNMDAIIENIGKMTRFHAVGVTEKELGVNFKERMINIARIRRALNGVGLENMPIHIFGSLDTISTPLYFVAGADIFDGLTWLRFAYYNGLTIYRQNYSALEFEIDMKSLLVDARCYFDNYRYMKGLEAEMRGYLKEGIASFTHHRELVQRAYQTVAEEMED